MTSTSPEDGKAIHSAALCKHAALQTGDSGISKDHLPPSLPCDAGEQSEAHLFLGDEDATHSPQL